VHENNVEKFRLSENQKRLWRMPMALWKRVNGIDKRRRAEEEFKRPIRSSYIEFGSVLRDFDKY